MKLFLILMFLVSCLAAAEIASHDEHEDCDLIRGQWIC